MTHYLGLDWLAMALTFTAIYLLGNKSRIGFVVMMVGNLCWAAIGLWAHSLRDCACQPRILLDECSRRSESGRCSSHAPQVSLALLDSRQPSPTETSHEMSRRNRRRRDEEAEGVVGLPVLEHGVHRMKQLDGDHDQRLLSRFALGLLAEINGAPLATMAPL